MSLKVIGTGLGRTGTYSLKLALELLGFGKCYHMTELFQNPEGLKHFLQAEKGEKVRWDELFQGYKSAVDYPAYCKITSQEYSLQCAIIPFIRISVSMNYFCFRILYSYLFIIPGRRIING